MASDTLRCGLECGKLQWLSDALDAHLNAVCMIAALVPSDGL